MNRAGSWVLVAFALVVLSGCCEREPPEDVQRREQIEEAREVCPTMADVQQEYGGSIGGTYGGGTFLEYVIEMRKDGSPRVKPPNTSECAQEIAIRLEQACSICNRDANACLGLVTSFFETPSNNCVYCGDQICWEGAETMGSCPADCRCGNGLCEGVLARPENPATCPQDCAGSCGDGYCADPVEACRCEEGAAGCRKCEEDCCFVVCGDGECDVEGGENDENHEFHCEVDCGKGWCGDDVCHLTENVATCPRDCSGMNCGDGVCAKPENCFNCPSDCGGAYGTTCFDGICANCEFWTCRTDCEELPFDCGNGECDEAENPTNCPVDCSWSDCPLGEDQQPACFGVCGDNVCTPNENEWECQDCVSCDPDQLVNTHTRLCWADETYCGGDHNNLDSVDLVDCSQRDETCPELPVVTQCAGRCKQTANGAQCVDCPRVERGQRGMTLCNREEEPFCATATRLSVCEVDPEYSSNPDCAIRSTIYCPGVCVDGQCDEEAHSPYVAVASPEMGAPGDQVHLLGLDFGMTAGRVFFTGGADAEVLEWTDRSVRVVVPQGAVTGDVTLETPAGTSATPFTVPDGPTIIRISPASGVAGDYVGIHGVLFGETLGSVTFAGNVTASVLRWDDRLITTRVPPGARTGPITVHGDGWVLSTEQFLVQDFAPEVTSVSPNEGYPGDQVTIDGRYFPEGITVTFAFGVRAEIVSRTPDRIVVTVPVGARKGFITLEVGRYRVNSPRHFTVGPEITNVTSCQRGARAAPNEPVLIQGTNLAGVEVRFNGIFAQSFLAIDTQVWAIVPRYVQTGPLRVTAGNLWREVPFEVVQNPRDYAWSEWTVPDSETTFCSFDNQARECPEEGQRYFGQDGNYQINPPQIEREEPVWHDRVSGLSWAPGGPSNWFLASCSCITGEWGGQTDWRLPSVIELISLVDYGAEQWHHGQVRTIQSTWTSQRYQGARDHVWHMTANATIYFEVLTNTHYTWCVRGGDQ